MARKKVKSSGLVLESILPIDISLPKAYVLADVPFDKSHWTRVFRLSDSDLCVARVTQFKPLSKQVQVKLEAQKTLSTEEINEITKKLRFELGLDEKMKVLRSARRKEILVDIAVKSNPGFRIYANSNPVETAVLTIISQNMSFFSYLEMVDRFVKQFGEQVPWDKNLYAFPEKEKLAEMSTDDWNSIKIGYKAKYLGNYSETEYEAFEIYSNYPVYKRGLGHLLEIKGVGDYTARLLMIYHARRYDNAFRDTYVREVLQHKFGIIGWNTTNEFDEWIENRWRKDPALILHTLLLDYLPAYLQDHQY